MFTTNNIREYECLRKCGPFWNGSKADYNTCFPTVVTLGVIVWPLAVVVNTGLGLTTGLFKHSTSIYYLYFLYKTYLIFVSRPEFANVENPSTNLLPQWGSNANIYLKLNNT